MSDNPKPAPNRDDLLKSIDGKLTWGVILLFIIMLNTCSVSDDVQDAIRDSRRADRAAPEAVTPAPVTAPPAEEPA
ncbi:hypothetical protein [Brevundimonas sp. Root1423]|uniref:hypothetical protein n=1 Tax=Brevundimonas sp. Root1423 TaxID=1736462 RepID=UPI0006F7C451|nr:hypothetical protein [Brevundimonas sp. Root1423]KQY75503.1 hypothetical protein ASD25_13315 [Brevundimonas sp. Root1423]